MGMGHPGIWNNVEKEEAKLLILLHPALLSLLVLLNNEDILQIMGKQQQTCCWAQCDMVGYKHEYTLHAWPSTTYSIAPVFVEYVNTR